MRKLWERFLKHMYTLINNIKNKKKKGNQQNVTEQAIYKANFRRQYIRYWDPWGIRMVFIVCKLVQLVYMLIPQITHLGISENLLASIMGKRKKIPKKNGKIIIPKGISTPQLFWLISCVLLLIPPVSPSTFPPTNDENQICDYSLEERHLLPVAPQHSRVKSFNMEAAWFRTYSWMIVRMYHSNYPDIAIKARAKMPFMQPR